MSLPILPTTLPPGWQETRPLPRSTAIQAAVADVIGSVPDDKHLIVVATATFYGAKLAAMVRGPQGFSFVGWVGREWGGNLSGGAELRFMR
jgi:hypothetical protein